MSGVAILAMPLTMPATSGALPAQAAAPPATTGEAAAPPPATTSGATTAGEGAAATDECGDPRYLKG